MTWQERRAALEALSARDKQILALARTISNNMCFAAQNAHSDRIQEKYERRADQAMLDLESLLIAGKEGQQ